MNTKPIVEALASTVVSKLHQERANLRRAVNGSVPPAPRVSREVAHG